MTPRPLTKKHALFIKLWNARAPISDIRVQCGYKSGGVVLSTAGSLRRRGYLLVSRRITSQEWHVRHRFKPSASQKEGDRELRRINVAPAIIMDKDGSPIATMDPITRERRALV